MCVCVCVHACVSLKTVEGVADCAPMNLPTAGLCKGLSKLSVAHCGCAWAPDSCQRVSASATNFATIIIRAHINKTRVICTVRPWPRSAYSTAARVRLHNNWSTFDAGLWPMGEGHVHTHRYAVD